MNTLYIRNVFQERIRSVVDSIHRKEPGTWEKRIAAKVFEIYPAMAGASAQFAKGPGSSCSITTPCQTAG